MAEPVHVAGVVDHEQLCVDRGADSGFDVGLVRATTIAARSSWLVARPIVARISSTWRGGVVETGDLCRDQVGQHHRDGLARHVRGDELLREERISLSTREHLVDERVRRGWCPSVPRPARRHRRGPALPDGSDEPPGAGSAPPVDAAVTDGDRPRWRGTYRRGRHDRRSGCGRGTRTGPTSPCRPSEGLRRRRPQRHRRRDR